MKLNPIAELIIQIVVSLIVITVMLMALLVCCQLAGCASLEAEIRLDGTATLKKFELFRIVDIDSFSYDDGSFTFDGYRSDTARALNLLDKWMSLQ